MKCREEASRKETQELYEIEKVALAMIKYHQSKNSLSDAAMFDVIDTGKDDKIDQDEFIAFLKRCDKAPKEKDEKDGESKNGETTAEAELPSDDDLTKLFGFLDEDE